MNVLMVEPGKAPYETQIGDDLQSMQALVGGYLEAVYPFEQPVALVCRESGKLDGLPLNRALRDSDGDICDIVAGNFFIVGLEKQKPKTQTHKTFCRSIPAAGNVRARG